MLKAILTSTVLAFFCGSALADDAAVTYRIDYAGNTVFVADNTCGEVATKSPLREDRLKVCARPVDSKRVRLEVDRHLRDKADEKRVSVTIVVAPGATFDMQDGKLSVKLQ